MSPTEPTLKDDGQEGGQRPDGQSAAADGERSAAASSADVREAEWQFEAPDVSAPERWIAEHARFGPFRIVPGGFREIRDLYLDTADLRIMRAGYALRIRETADAVVASLTELAPRDGGFTVRREIAQTLASSDKVALFEGSGPVTSRLRLLCREAELGPLAPIRTERRGYRIIHGTEPGRSVHVVSGDGSGVAEQLRPGGWQFPARIALERSLLTDPLGRIHQLPRLEIAVPHEDVPTFCALADRLRDECGLKYAERSKFEWAIQLNGIRVDASMSLGAEAIKRTMSVGQVADAVLRRHLAALLWHEPGTRLGDDPEHLHKMRVAARRLRAALKLFGRAYPEGEADRLRRALGAIGRRLGEVRDLDVFSEVIGRLRGGLLTVDAAACDPLLRHLARQRERAREQLAESLDSPAFAALTQDFARLLQAGPPVGRPGADVPILEFGPGVIRRTRREVTHLGRGLTLDSPTAEYHRLRICGKRLRYTLEFVEDIYGAAATEMIAILVEVQDHLGLHQDAQVSINKLRTIASERPAGFTPEGWLALGELSQVYRTRAEQLRAGLPRLLRRLERKRWRALQDALRKMSAEEGEKEIANTAPGGTAGKAGPDGGLPGGGAAGGGTARPALRRGPRSRHSRDRRS